ncbi:hypothetical protein AgCh_011576 [Apium graveolens]
MNTTFLSFPAKPLTTILPTKFPLHHSTQLHHQHSLSLPPLKSSTDSTNNNITSTPKDGEVAAPSSPEVAPIRFKRVSRRRARQQELEQSTPAPKQPKPPKEWEAMTLNEKALELYVGEKGLLFWLNKFAYASIYIIIGAWICFRFVGPALNLYQLDAPPLSPTDVLKGSS